MSSACNLVFHEEIEQEGGFFVLFYILSYGVLYFCDREDYIRINCVGLHFILVKIRCIRLALKKCRHENGMPERMIIYHQKGNKNNFPFLISS